ncbi:MAG: neutral/alkaline non-lysosomal ceramidase N-terminal domain-containing protein [Armatimonadetes bacterium]|nr:neutral/alkaline non-lysosomal ceramidase N-terminal domain-containing protein [Armatimonadota bacterium]
MSPLRAGTAKADITPPLHIPYLAYHPRHGTPQGVHDSLHARALVVESEGETAALLSVDSIGFSRKVLGPGRDFTAELRQRVSENTGIASSHVLLAASHAHSTPETLNFKPLRDRPGGAEWLEGLLDSLAGCVGQAYRRLRPARLKIGKGQCHQISWNRHSKKSDGSHLSFRDENSKVEVKRPIDPEVDVLLIEYEDGPPDSVLRFTCHPVIVQVQPLWSADFPGVACSVVEQATGGNCLFLQGCAGDINPVCGTAGFEEVSRIGRCLGAEAWKVLEELQCPEGFLPVDRRSSLAGPLKVLSSVVKAQSRELPDLAPWEREESESLHLFETGETEEVRQQASLRYRAAFSIADRLRMGSEPFDAEVQVMRLGDFAVAALPGELFVEYGFDVRDASPFKHTWVVAYCNDYLGYISRPWAWEERCYPTQVGPWCLLSQQGGQTVVDEATRVLGLIGRGVEEITERDRNP